MKQDGFYEVLRKGRGYWQRFDPVGYGPEDIATGLLCQPEKIPMSSLIRLLDHMAAERMIDAQKSE